MSAAGRGTVRVLVVEDNRSMCQEICRRLRAHGYDADGVADSRQALAQMRHEDFAAVVADLSLARTHDLDLVREVQGLAGFRPWVMYTGTPDPVAAHWGGRRGVFCVLMKGAPVRHLLRSIEEACRATSPVRHARCA